MSEKLKNQGESQKINISLKYNFSVDTPEKLDRFYSVLAKFNEIWNLEMKKKKGTRICPQCKEPKTFGIENIIKRIKKKLGRSLIQGKPLYLNTIGQTKKR